MYAMICPNCNKENPDHANFCKHCGNKLSQNIICPTCRRECAQNTSFCPACGTALNGSQIAAEKQRERSEKTKKTLHLVSGIFMMIAVLFALVFVFFIGTTQRVDGDHLETFTVWHYFGRAYTLLESTSAGYSPYTVAAHYIPVVLSTAVAAGTLVSVVVFSLIAAVKFGLHFKRKNVSYYKYAVTAVFSFLLGATLFDCIHSVSTENNYGALSGTTVTGMVFACLLVVCSLIIKASAIGKDFKKKQTVIDYVSTLAGILCLAILIGFAKAEQAKYTASEWFHFNYHISFIRINTSLSFVADNAAPFTLSVCAVAAQIALIVLAFIALILHMGNFTEKRTFSLGIAVALTAVAAAHLALSVTALEVANDVAATSLPELRLTASPILAFIFSVLYLAASITNKALTKKTKESE